MSDEELLKQAENYADDMYKENSPEWASAKAQSSIALSLLVIARNSLPVTVSLTDEERSAYNPVIVPRN